LGHVYCEVKDMGVYIKPLKNAVTKIADKTFDLLHDQLHDQLCELEQRRQRYIESLNHEVAIKYAETLGLRPVKNLGIIREMLNERIISEVKTQKLRHIDVAAITQLHRPRITAIMNRQLDRVTIDCMVQILNMLGIPPTIKF
jgi:predicted XRE-type DNA-binding protein